MFYEKLGFYAQDDDEDDKDFIAPPTPTGERPAKRAKREDDLFSTDSGIFTPEAVREQPADAGGNAGAEAESEREDDGPTPDGLPASPSSPFDDAPIEPLPLTDRVEVQEENVESCLESKEDVSDRWTPSGSEAEKSASGSERSRTSGEGSRASAQTSASSQMIVEPERDEEFRKYHGK